MQTGQLCDDCVCVFAGCMQELYNVEHFAIKTIAITFWRLPVIFIVMFIVRGTAQQCSLHSSLLAPGLKLQVLLSASTTVRLYRCIVLLSLQPVEHVICSPKAVILVRSL